MNTFRSIVKGLQQQVFTSHSKSEKPCNPKNSNNLLKITNEKIASRIGCNLPWAKYKLDSLDVCNTDEQFTEYVALFHDESYADELNTLKPNCKVTSWKVMNTFETYEQGGNATVVSLTSNKV